MSGASGESPLGEPKPGDGRFGSRAEGLPENWKGALVGLVASRVEILSVEAKEAIGSAGGKIALLLTGFFFLLTAWVLLLAGAVGGIASATDWKWYHVAFAAAGIHFLLALIAVLVAKSRKSDSFAVTRAEFEKDREWLNQLKNPKG